MIVGSWDQRLDVKADRDVQVTKNAVLLLIEGRPIRVYHQRNFRKALPHNLCPFHNLFVDKAVTKEAESDLLGDNDIQPP